MHGSRATAAAGLIKAAKASNAQVLNAFAALMGHGEPALGQDSTVHLEGSQPSLSIGTQHLSQREVLRLLACGGVYTQPSIRVCLPCGGALEPAEAHVTTQLVACCQHVLALSHVAVTFRCPEGAADVTVALSTPQPPSHPVHEGASALQAAQSAVLRASLCVTSGAAPREPPPAPVALDSPLSPPLDSKRTFTLSYWLPVPPGWEGHVAMLALPAPAAARGSASLWCADPCPLISVEGFTQPLKAPSAQSPACPPCLAGAAQPWRCVAVAQWGAASSPDHGACVLGVCAALAPSLAHAARLWSHQARGRGEESVARMPLVEGPLSPPPVGPLPPLTLPRHLALIMDGNGRWAKRHGLPRSKGHTAGVDSIHRVIRAARRLAIPTLTLYAFSSQNWARPAGEVAHLMQLLEHFVFHDCQQLVDNGVRLVTLGDTGRLPPAARDGLRALAATSAGNTALTLVLALSYGGQEEIAAAAGEAAQDVLDGKLCPAALGEDVGVLGAYMPLHRAGLPDPDLLVRSSGELRLSNFLLWHMAYAEICVTPVLWPDFSEAHLVACIADFASRQRRFGLTGEQVNGEDTGALPSTLPALPPKVPPPSPSAARATSPTAAHVLAAAQRTVGGSGPGWLAAWAGVAALLATAAPLCSLPAFKAPPLPACLAPGPALGGAACLPITPQAAAQAGGVWLVSCLWAALAQGGLGVVFLVLVAVALVAAPHALVGGSV